MGIAIMILGILLTADAAAVMVMLQAWTITGLAVGLFLIIWGFNYKNFKNGNWFTKFLNVIFMLFLVYVIGISCFLGAYGSFGDANYSEDYAVVLGCAVRNSQPMPDLTQRLNTAIDYCEKNPNATVIVSGGQGRDENVSEAAVMHAYLTEHGVSADRIIKEDGSRNTRENMMLSDAITGGALQGSGVVTITNDYHAFRAKMYANQYGIDTHTLGTRTKWYLIPVSYVRESLAMIKLFISYLPIGNIG